MKKKPKNKTVAGVAILTPDKTEFKMKAITRDKERPSNSTSGYLSEETPDNKLYKDIYTHMFIAALYIIAKI